MTKLTKNCFHTLRRSQFTSSASFNTFSALLTLKCSIWNASEFEALMGLPWLFASLLAQFVLEIFNMSLLYTGSPTLITPSEPHNSISYWNRGVWLWVPRVFNLDCSQLCVWSICNSWNTICPRNFFLFPPLIVRKGKCHHVWHKLTHWLRSLRSRGIQTQLFPAPYSFFIELPFYWEADSYNPFLTMFHLYVYPEKEILKTGINLCTMPASEREICHWCIINLAT